MYAIKEGKPQAGLEKPNMVMVYAESDLHTLLNNRTLDDETRKKWTLDLLEGLKAVHEGIMDETDQKIVLIHNDLKPKNILIVNGEAKIADFGLTVDTKADPNEKLWGSILWFSPKNTQLEELTRIFRDQKITY